MSDPKGKVTNTVFCTECGDDLTDFSFTEKVNHIDEVKENFENCKRIGRFKGEQCSKLFIASTDDDAIINEDV